MGLFKPKVNVDPTLRSLAVGNYDDDGGIHGFNEKKLESTLGSCQSMIAQSLESGEQPIALKPYDTMFVLQPMYEKKFATGIVLVTNRRTVALRPKKSVFQIKHVDLAGPVSVEDGVEHLNQTSFAVVLVSKQALDYPSGSIDFQLNTMTLFGTRRSDLSGFADAINQFVD